MIGKSTTIAALTGMTEATSGDVSIYGYLLSKELQAIRQLTGLWYVSNAVTMIIYVDFDDYMLGNSPQHNVLFPMLTVREHLHFFGKLKGMSGVALQDRIEHMIKEVGLTEKRDTRSQALSGGMKRKLCLAMALIGDPKFVLLDEPTSGMDPYSRRATWELLQRHKASRVILLTTHFMDEADTLADRIAIMSEGLLLCSGSSLFLKNKFGAGYLLIFSKVSTDSPVELIEAEVKSIISSAQLLSSVAGEVIYRLPLIATHSFHELFASIDSKKHSMGIRSFGLSITSLEQVFISLAKQRVQIPPLTSFKAEWNCLSYFGFCGSISSTIDAFRSFHCLFVCGLYENVSCILINATGR
jgi:ABC-type multidrug transport system ATPase subunit